MYDNSEELETIPVVVDGDEIVIQTAQEKRTSTDILLFKRFNTKNCVIRESTSQVLFEPFLEEVLGDYPEDEMESYMQLLYDELISNLTMFDRKDDYFSAINGLKGFAFNRYTGNPDKPCYGLSFGFTGNENVKWDPGFANFGEVSMIFSESSPYVW